MCYSHLPLLRTLILQNSPAPPAWSLKVMLLYIWAWIDISNSVFCFEKGIYRATINNNNNNYICIALYIWNRSQSAHNTWCGICSFSGDMMKPSGWFISIEGHVVMGPHSLFLHAKHAFFSSYYVFNLEYPAVGLSTLEFIQSYCIKITFNLVIHIIV